MSEIPPPDPRLTGKVRIRKIDSSAPANGDARAPSARADRHTDEGGGRAEVSSKDEAREHAGAEGQRAQESGSGDREPRIRLIPFSEIALGTERRDLVKGFIPREGLVVVWGPPKSGKSFWVFDLIMHVALGWEYRGRRVQQGAVVYCAFEGQQGIRARAEAFRQRFLREHPEAVPFFLEPVTLNLVADHAELIDAIRAKCNPSAVVLDTLNRSLCGSESKDEDMAAYIRAADAIREAFDCAVIIVHHCGVDGSRPRGHTSLSGAVEVQIAISRGASENVIATVELAKDGPQGDTIASRLETVTVGHDEDGENITSCNIVPVDGLAVQTRTVAKKLTNAAQIALRALREAVAEAGEAPSASNHFPTGVSVVLLRT